MSRFVLQKRTASRDRYCRHIAISCIRTARWTIGMALVLTCWTFYAIGQEPAAVPADQDAYSKLRLFSLSDLRSFATAYPTSDKHDFVLESMSMLSKLEGIRAGKIVPKYIIPFSALGHWDDGSSVWQNYRDVSPDREAAGWFYRNHTSGIFCPIATACHRISMGNGGRPLWPAGDGSVWGVESEDLVQWFPGLKIRTQGRMIFGVVQGKGLVCLQGTGTIVFVNEHDRQLTIK